MRPSTVVVVPVPKVVLIGVEEPERYTVYPVMTAPSAPTSVGASHERSTVPGGENGATEVRVLGAVGAPGDFLLIALDKSPVSPLLIANVLRALIVKLYV
jgi:hypothetical protein